MLLLFSGSDWQSVASSIQLAWEDAGILGCWDVVHKSHCRIFNFSAFQDNLDSQERQNSFILPVFIFSDSTTEVQRVRVGLSISATASGQYSSHTDRQFRVGPRNCFIFYFYIDAGSSLEKAPYATVKPWGPSSLLLGGTQTNTCCDLKLSSISSLP